MAINTQRLMIIIITINIVISLMFAMYQAPNAIGFSSDSWRADIQSVLGDTIELGENTAVSTSAESSERVTEGSQEEGTWGDGIRMGATVVKLFVRGLVALPWTDDAFGEDPVMNIAGNMLRLWWTLMYFLIALEIFLIIKNRKST